MDYIKDVDLMMFVTNLGLYHVQLVREFIVNQPEKIADPDSLDFMKVYVCGQCFEFSPRAINEFLGRTAHVSIDPLSFQVCACQGDYSRQRGRMA